MKPTRSFFLITVCLCLPALPAVGQFYPPMTIDPSLLKFLPEDAAFTATVEVSNRSEGYRWPVRVAFLKGQTRVETDISKMERDRKVPMWTDYVGRMEQAGSAQSVSSFSGEKKSVFIVLPSLKAYMEQPIPDDALPQLEKRPKARKVEMGTEEVAGRAATKTKLNFNKDGMDIWRTWETPEAIVWMAKETPGIPLRIQVLDSVGEINAALAFTDIDSKKPAADLFAPPKGFTKCDQESLMKRIMEKWLRDK